MGDQKRENQFRDSVDSSAAAGAGEESLFWAHVGNLHLVGNLKEKPLLFEGFAAVWP